MKIDITPKEVTEAIAAYKEIEVTKSKRMAEVSDIFNRLAKIEESLREIKAKEQK